MPRKALPVPQLNKEVFLNYLPQYTDLPEVDIRVLMWHFLGCDNTLIAQRVNVKKSDVEMIIDRHDPERTLSLNRDIKLAYVDHTVLDIATTIVGTITGDEIKNVGSPQAKLNLVLKLLEIHKALKPQLPKETDSGSEGALRRLKGKNVAS